MADEDVGERRPKISYVRPFQAWWPDFDHKPANGFAEVMRHLHELWRVADLCPVKGVCIQAGGNAGLYPRELAKYFDHVLTFEPDYDLYHCILRNIEVSNAQGKGTVAATNCALDRTTGTAFFKRAASSGAGRLHEGPSLNSIQVLTLHIDGMDLAHIDAIVLDVEGRETDILLGAAKTIAAFRPVIQVELHEKHRERLEAHLKDIGYKLVKRIGRDGIYVHS